MENEQPDEQVYESIPVETSFCELIGKKVTFSVTKLTYSQGTVIDKVIMLHKVKDEDKTIPITGYLVQRDEDGVLTQIQYWRLLRVIEKENLDKVPLTVIKGGFDRETRSEVK